MNKLFFLFTSVIAGFTASSFATPISIQKLLINHSEIIAMEPTESRENLLYSCRTLLEALIEQIPEEHELKDLRGNVDQLIENWDEALHRIVFHKTHIVMERIRTSHTHLKSPIAKLEQQMKVLSSFKSKTDLQFLIAESAEKSSITV